jgi:hypothetical protein
MIKEECYLEFKEWGQTIKIATEESGITADEFYEMCKKISLAAFGKANTNINFKQKQ